MFLKLAVGAEVAAVAGLVVAFGGHHAVETAFAAVVGDVVVLDAGLFFGLGTAETGFHFVGFGQFAFAVEIDVLLEVGEVFETVTKVVHPGRIPIEHADHLTKLSGTSFLRGCRLLSSCYSSSGTFTCSSPSI